MAVTITILRSAKSDRESVRDGTLDFNNNYSGIGELFYPSLLNLTGFNHVSIMPKGGYVFEYDYTAQRVKVFYADYDATADGALIEVPMGTDLSALTGVRYRVFGY